MRVQNSKTNLLLTKSGVPTSHCLICFCGVIFYMYEYLYVQCDFYIYIYIYCHVSMNSYLFDVFFSAFEYVSFFWLRIQDASPLAAPGLITTMIIPG